MFTSKATFLGVLVVVVALAVAFHVLTAAGSEPRSGPLRVAQGLERVPRAYVRARTLVKGNRASRLAGSVSGALMGPLAPVASQSADGHYVAYSTWAARELDLDRSLSKQGVRPGDALGSPSLGVIEVATGRAVRTVAGAYSAAWRADGALAYVRGIQRDFVAGAPFTGQIVVRATVGGPEIAWTTTPDRYVVYGWAGGSLLAYRIEEGERLEVLALDGPGRVRAISPGSVIAVSPDGAQVLLVAPDDRHLRVLEVDSGREVASLDLSTTELPVEWAGYSGSWVADHVVAPASPGLVVFHVTSSGIDVEQVLALDPDEFPAGVQEPFFADESANTILATVDSPPRAGSPATTALLECDRVARACRRGEPAPAREWLRLVRNPSRPGGED